MNKVNDLGVAPLGYALMFPQAEPKRKRHRKLILWLIEKGADVHHVDKGGHTAIEFASQSGIMENVSLLLKAGARVKREVEFLSMDIPDAVQVAGTADVKSLMQAKLRQEVDATEKLRLQRLEEDMVSRRARAPVPYPTHRMCGLTRYRPAFCVPQARLVEKEKQKRKEQIRREIEARRRAKQERNRAVLEASLRKKAGEDKYKPTDAAKSEAAEFADAVLRSQSQISGVWEKADRGVWTYKPAEQDKAASRSVFEEAGALYEDERGEAARSMLRRRWKAMTGLEVTDDHPVMAGEEATKEQR